MKAIRSALIKSTEILRRQPKPLLAGSGFIFVLLVGVADYLTGTEVSVSIFYLVPIALLTWFVGNKAGVFLSVGSCLVELMADFFAGYGYPSLGIALWNNSIRLVFFLIFVFILSALKAEYRKSLKLITDLQGTLGELQRTQAEVEQKANALARSNNELEQFAYVAAHDLKEPLIVAGGNIHLLRRLCKDKLEPGAERFIGYALDGITRMEALINALLTYSRVGTKTKELKLTDCNTVIECAIANLQLKIETSGAIVTCDQLPILLADDIQMTQLFQNLIGNGIKFRGEKPPRVHVSAEQKEREWIFFVRDNGIGIPPTDSDRIFNIFQRVGSSSKYPGNGIGLATCKKIVENHGGRIWVEACPGEGSTFKFIIPIKNTNLT